MLHSARGFSYAVVSPGSAQLEAAGQLLIVRNKTLHLAEFDFGVTQLQAAGQLLIVRNITQPVRAVGVHTQLNRAANRGAAVYGAEIAALGIALLRLYIKKGL